MGARRWSARGVREQDVGYGGRRAPPTATVLAAGHLPRKAPRTSSAGAKPDGHQSAASRREGEGGRSDHRPNSKNMKKDVGGNMVAQVGTHLRQQPDETIGKIIAEADGQGRQGRAWITVEESAPRWTPRSRLSKVCSSTEATCRLTS